MAHREKCVNLDPIRSIGVFAAGVLRVSGRALLALSPRQWSRKTSADLQGEGLPVYFDDGWGIEMLLINPATEKFGGFLSRYVPVGIPVAIGYIAAYLESHGIRCRVIDEEVLDITPSVLRERLEGMERPYVVGVSCLTAHVGRGYQIAGMVKAEFPDAIVVFGGLHPTTLPEEALKTGHVDYVVRGEGEEIMLQLYRAIRGEQDATKILGVSYVREGKVFNNTAAPLIPSIDDIPNFPYHLFNHPKYDMGFMTTSRGCPYRCSYCSQRLLTGTTYRYRSAQKIVEELDVLVNQYGQKAVVFYDDNFCLKARRVHELCDMIVERGLHNKVKLSVQTRADNVLFHGGEDLVRHMAEAGFTHMGFGMETGVQRLADLIRKDETIKCHLETAALCKKYGMDVSLFMIFGLPTETAADRNESFNVVRNAGVVATKYNNLIPYPGTPMWNELKESGRVAITDNWGNFNSVLAMTSSIFDKTPLPYVPESCSEWELKRDIIKYNLRSYVNLKSIAAIFGHTKGIGWFMLPEKWYRKPREIFEIAKIGMHLLTNICIVSIPLSISEFIMTALNPKMRKRSRVEGYDPSTYRLCDWDENETKNLILRLKTAREEHKATGSFNVFLNNELKQASLKQGSMSSDETRTSIA
jgi:anaerobic magnesium-protoporphyrin IX monomethyl ester cyclase